VAARKKGERRSKRLKQFAGAAQRDVVNGFSPTHLKEVTTCLRLNGVVDRDQRRLIEARLLRTAGLVGYEFARTLIGRK